MRTDDTPEPLWRAVVGDTEPWRRGRLFLIALAVWTLLSQSVAIGQQILQGRVESVLSASVGALVFWLLFYFIWIGVHWVRWLIGGFSMLLAFANLIWGIRDGNAIRVIEGTVGLPIAAYLALAPSVYFFALRQKESVRWKETLVVAAIFGLLLASFGVAIFALWGYKAERETRGRAFADTTFRRIFAEGDAEFLKEHATARLLREEGWERLSWFMADRYLRVGAVEKLQPAEGQVRFWFQFPVTLGSHGYMSTVAASERGPVRLHARIGEAGDEWQIDGIWWRYADPSALPAN